MTAAGPSALLRLDHRPALARVLLDYTRHRRWFRAKSRPVREAHLVDVIPLEPQERGQGDVRLAPVLAILELNYQAGGADLYVLPLAWVDAAAAGRLEVEAPHAIVARLSVFDGIGPAWREHALVDGLVTGAAATPLFETVRRGVTVRGESGQLRGQPTAGFAAVAGSGPLTASASLARVEQTNSTLVFADRVLMKIYRQLGAGANPEWEVGLFLTQHNQPSCAPRVLGELVYTGPDRAEHSVGILHEFLANDGDAWTMTLQAVRDYFAHGGTSLGAYAAQAATLGRRTGQLHLALAAGVDDPAFAPEPLTAADATEMAADVAAALDRLGRQRDALISRLPSLDARLQATAKRLFAPEGQERLAGLLRAFREAALDVVKTRVHGDLHLGQVLVRGDDFMIIDFEGEPHRPLAQRRAKSSPLRDVMGMVRSFDYAPAAVLREGGAAAGARQTSLWARQWTTQVTEIYLRSYLDSVAGAPFIPRVPALLTLMLTFYQLEKVVYEVGYELDNRPDWLAIPLAGLARIAGLADEGDDT